MSDGTFLLSISGQIEFIEVMSSAGSSFHCKYEFYSGPDWKIIGGLEAGLSQIANVVNNNDKVVLNFPIDVQFKSTNPYGWPQMVLSVYEEMTLEGYGRAHMPIKPGHHHLEVNLSKPKASSLLGYIGTFFGYQPELLQPKVLATTAGNNCGEDGEIFGNRKGYFSLNVQVVCDSHLSIRDIVCRWPGSTHDMTMFNNSRIRARMEGVEFLNCLILGDSGYALREYCLTPLLQPGTRAENLCNEADIRTRNTIERTFGVWERRFPAIAYGLRCNLQTNMSIIIATAVLHNVAIPANEDVPPVPENVNQDQLNYLIAQGNIPDIVAPNNGGVIDYRRELSDNYFLNLH